MKMLGILSTSKSKPLTGQGPNQLLKRSPRSGFSTMKKREERNLSCSSRPSGTDCSQTWSWTTASPRRASLSTTVGDHHPQRALMEQRGLLQTSYSWQAVPNSTEGTLSVLCLSLLRVIMVTVVTVVVEHLRSLSRNRLTLSSSWIGSLLRSYMRRRYRRR